MDYPILIDTVSMELSNLYFKGVTGQNFFQMMYFCPRKMVLSSPDEKPPYVAFHLGLHCLPKYLFTAIQNDLFACVDALHPNQQFYSHVETISCLPGLIHY